MVEIMECKSRITHHGVPDDLRLLLTSSSELSAFSDACSLSTLSSLAYFPIVPECVLGIEDAEPRPGLVAREEVRGSGGEAGSGSHRPRMYIAP